MVSPDVLSGQTVIVKQRRVAQVGPTRSVKIPPDAIVVNGEGGYLMPGLIDAHVHVRDRELDAYVEVWAVVSTLQSRARMFLKQATGVRAGRG